MKLHLAAGLAALAITNPVNAQGTLHLGGKATLANNAVIQAVLETGAINVVKDDPTECKDPSLGGAFITYGPNIKPVLLICMKNAETYAELADTIRHEAYHAVSWCRGGSLFTWEKNIELAHPYDIGMVYKYYEPKQWNDELEARSAARYLTDSDIAEQVNKYCM